MNFWAEWVGEVVKIFWVELVVWPWKVVVVDLKWDGLYVMRRVCLLCGLMRLMSLMICEICKVQEIFWAGKSGWGVKILEGWAEGLAVKIWWCELDSICSELIVLYEISLFVVLVVWIDEFDILWKLQSSRNFWAGMSGWGVKILEVWPWPFAQKFWWCQFDFICSEQTLLVEIHLSIV